MAAHRPRRRRRVGFPILLCGLLLALLAPGSAPATTNMQASLLPQSVQPPSQTKPPPGFSISARQAGRAADRVLEVRRQIARHGHLRRSIAIPTYIPNDRIRFEVLYSTATEDLVEVQVSGRTGRVLEVWTGPQLDFPFTRGYEPSVGRSLNKAWIWLPLCVLFVAPFFDPRRPFRLLHLDLLVLLAFGVSVLLFNRGELHASVISVYPLLAYLLVRMLLAGLGPRERREALVPFAPTALLVVGLVVLVGFRIGLNVVDSNVIDVGYASVVGADRITHGEELYVDNDVHGDTYGPIAYVAYTPFEALLPWSGAWDDLPAAHAAAIAFDLLTILGLLLLGGRLWPGREGRRLGIALAFAWAAFPFTTYVLQSNTNDGLIGMLLVFALLALTSAPGRGIVLALATAAKFAPVALAPLFAAGLGERRPRDWLRFGAAFGAVIVVTTLAYLPPGGLRELYDTTIGFQLGRESPLSLWGLYPQLGPLQDAVKVGAAALTMVVAFFPRKRDGRQVAALGAAVIVAVQLTATHWFFFYLVWLAPLALVATFAAYRPPAEAAPVERPPQAERELVPA
jgi:hypothetical protein